MATEKKPTESKNTTPVKATEQSDVKKSPAAKTVAAKKSTTVKKTATAKKDATVKKTAATKKDATVKKTAAAKKSTTVKKTAAAKKSTTAKKATEAKKAETKDTLKVAARVIYQYEGTSVVCADLADRVKAAWAERTGEAASAIKSLDLYVKPEDGKVYYVINGKDFGDVPFAE